MFKTGLVGNDIPGPILKSILSHPAFNVTGCFYPEKNNHRHNIKSIRNIPVISKGILLERNDVLIFQKADIYTLEIISEALKQSKHVMLIDAGGLPCDATDNLIKLREESQTVFKIKQHERSGPALNACLPLMNHPSLIEIKLIQTTTGGKNWNISSAGTLFRMIDILLFLCPYNIKRIQALQQPERLTLNRLISARIEFDNGTVANLLSTNISEKDSFLIDIYQKNKNLRIDLLRDKLTNTEITELNNKINSKTDTFRNTTGRSFYNELDSLYHSIVNNIASGKELFEVFKIVDLSFKIFEKSGISEMT